MQLEIAKFDVVPIVIRCRITEALVLRNGQRNEILRLESRKHLQDKQCLIKHDCFSTSKLSKQS